MKVGKLCIVSNPENLKRIKNAIKFENPEIPDLIYCEREPVWLGIGPIEKNSIIIRHGDACISRKHCVIKHQISDAGKDQWFLEDYSSNGTFINNERVPRDLKTNLSQGDIVVFGVLDSSALRYKFLEITKHNDLVRPSYESTLIDTFSSSIKKKKITPSTSSRTSGFIHELNAMEIPDLFNHLYSTVDSSLQSDPEFLCTMCQKICFIPVYFPCYHNFCFLCYSQSIYEKTSFCPKCNIKISKKLYPYKNFLVYFAIEKKLDPEALCALRILDEKIKEAELIMQRDIRVRANAKNSDKMQKQLPIYSAIWSKEHESQFQVSYSQMTHEEKLIQLRDKGLNSEFINSADEEKIDLVMERLMIYKPNLSLMEKRLMLEELLRSIN